VGLFDLPPFEEEEEEEEEEDEEDDDDDDFEDFDEDFEEEEEEGEKVVEGLLVYSSLAPSINVRTTDPCSVSTTAV